MEDSSMDNKMLTQMNTNLKKQIDYVKKNGFPGLYGEIAKSEDMKGLLSCKMDEDNLKENPKLPEELKVTIPFAGTSFAMKLLFNLHEPWVPPDFIFSDTKFMMSVLVKDLEDQVPCLDSWNTMSEDVVAQLFHQVHQLYKKFQLERLQEDHEIMQYEYQSLLQNLNLGEEDIEISVSGGSGWSVSVLLRLPLSTKDIPPVLIDAHACEIPSLLHVTLKKIDGSLCPYLYLSPQIESLVGHGNVSLCLPSVPPGSSLLDYVTQVVKLLKDRIKSSVFSFEMRKQLVAQVLCQYGGVVLEYDAGKFSWITLLLVWKDFHFLLIINLPPKFPDEQATLLLRSVYHYNKNGSFSAEVPYTKQKTATDSIEEILAEMKKAVFTYLPTFQTASINSQK